MGGSFSILVSGFFLFMTICYWISPKSIIAEKQEYVKFFLTFFIIYFALDGIVSLALYRVFNFSDSDMRGMWMLSVLSLCPLLFIFHLLYPFKEVKRNQHLTFFLFFASLF
ncbi:MAG: hypothetical protein LBS43_01055, partial [Prevotellaceae bacterium]|nr:hypothetical protein [Prevotellaceae bacterium]